MRPDARPLAFVAELGLCNRLRALVGVRTLAAARHAPFRLCWPVDAACDAAYDALFECDVTLISPEECRMARDRGEIEVIRDIFWFDKTWRRRAPSLPWRVFRDASLIRLRALRPVPALRARIDRFAEEQRLAEALGVHVRWTDNLDRYSVWQRQQKHFRPDRISTLEGFEARMGAALDAGEARRLFLATDNADVERRFRERFGERLVTLPKAYREVVRDGPDAHPTRGSSMDDAVVELYLLSRCRRLLGTYYSSFSKFAAVLGGRPYEQVEGGVARPSGEVRHLTGCAG